MDNSFAEAAKELSITASAVSHSIQALGEALGTLLFERAKRGVVPTAAGERLYLVIRKSFNDMDEELRSILDKSHKQQIVTIQCGDMGIAATAHHLVVPKSKEGLLSVQVVLEWMRNFTATRMGQISINAIDNDGSDAFPKAKFFIAKEKKHCASANALL